MICVILPASASDSATLPYFWQMEQISSPTKLIFVRFSRTCTVFHLTWSTYRLVGEYRDRGSANAFDPATGQFTRPEMLKVLTHSAVRAAVSEANTDRWRDWCLELGIVHGADRLDHQGTYIDRELFHWEQGLRRLVLGAS